MNGELENTGKNTGEREKVGKGKPPKSKQFKKGKSGNPNGRPKGARNYNTLFKIAMKEIKSNKDLKIKDPEVELIKRSIIEGLKGNYPHHRDIMDRRFGKPKETIEETGTIMIITDDI
jgi:hypothetical protein